MTRVYRIRNWHKYQHYRERNPPWIKLHVEMLASEEWVTLADADKLTAIVCMMIAAKEHGRLTDNADFIRRVAYLQATPDLGPLIASGFLEPIADADGSKEAPTDDDGRSTMQARADGCKPMLADARPEKETESEKEKERILSDPPPADADAAAPSIKSGRKNYPDDFEAFWRDYPTDALMSKMKAFEKWRRLSAEDRAAAARAVPGFRAHCGKNPTYRPVHAERFLSQRRFDGFNAQEDLYKAQLPPADEAGLRGEWGGNAEALVEAIGAAKFQAWFSGSAFSAGPPATIKVEKPFAAEWIRNHFMSDLRRLFGDVKIEVGQ